jgi:hypothetical protein
VILHDLNRSLEAYASKNLRSRRKRRRILEKLVIELSVHRVSRGSMVTIVSHSTILLKVLLLVVVANASASYGDCCGDMELSQAQSEMPCHNVDSATEAGEENCCVTCVTCVSMLAVQDPRFTPLDSAEIGTTALSAHRVFSPLPPPYRPPIKRFS